MRPRAVLEHASIALLYAATGWVGLGLATAPGNVTPVWLPSGIALAAVIRRGRSVAPAIFVGSLVLNALFYFDEGASVTEALGASSVIALGSAAQALAGAALVERFAGGANAMRAPRRIVALLGSAALACVIAPTVGVATVAAIGRTTEPGSTWLTWWLGDFVGIVMVVPLVLGARDGLAFEVRTVERALYAIALVVAIEVVFAPLGLGGQFAFPYLLLPVVVAIAYRLGPRDASLAGGAMYLGAAVGTAAGHGPYASLAPGVALLVVDGLLFAFSIPALLLSSAEWARREAAVALAAAHRDLERRVEERTAALASANARLSESEARLETAIESMPFDFTLVDADRRYVLMNQAAKRRWGDRVGSRMDEIEPARDPQRDFYERVARAYAGEVVTGAASFEHDGELRSQEQILAPIQVGDRIAGILIANVDVTERVRLAEQLVRAQKSEAVARLAGGIAHDFNNLLMVISAATEMLQRELGPDSPQIDLASSAFEAAARAAELTRRLLLFAGRQSAARLAAPLDGLVREHLELLRPLVPENVCLDVQLGPTGAVLLDPTQVGQVLLNLALNARDAMPEGGILRVHVSERTISAADAERWTEGVRAPGRYAVLEVADSGEGMTEEVQRLAFEPFFTTKGPGRGSGLGLASVHGIVRQSDGAIELESAPGRGTTFRLYFPIVASAARTPEPSAVGSAVRVAPASTVLLVEDEAAVRALIAKMLVSAGHRVLSAASAAEALEIASRERFDVLVSDVVMPGESGPLLARRLRETRPDLPVLFLSGYAEGSYSAEQITALGAPVLAKPCTAAELGAALATVMSRGRAGEHPSSTAA